MNKNSEVSLISIGYKVKDGIYTQIYSRHDRVLNFCSDNLLVSVCASCFCSGPYRIVLECDELSHIENIEVDNGTLKINGQYEILYSYDKTYRWNYRAPMMAKNVLWGRLVHSFEHYVKHAHPDSIISFINSDSSDKGSFDFALKSCFAEGMRHLRQGSYSAAVGYFRHRGIGLSPAGDDFLIGFVLATKWLELVQKKELSKITEIIIHESEVNNALIRTFMRQAAELDLDADWAKWLEALATYEMPLIPLLETLMKHGASSGADQLSGFFAACEVTGRITAIRI
jgi:hypothetical protein